MTPSLKCLVSCPNQASRSRATVVAAAAKVPSAGASLDRLLFGPFAKLAGAYAFARTLGERGYCVRGRPPWSTRSLFRLRLQPRS
jgi:hypothetical protein